MHSSMRYSAQPPSYSLLCLDRIQTRQVKKSSHTSHDGINTLPATLLISAGWSHAALPSNPGSALMSVLL